MQPRTRLPAGRGLAAGRATPGTIATVPVDAAVLPGAARVTAGLLRVVARGSLLWMAVALGDGALQANTLAQIRASAVLLLVPEAAARCVLRVLAG